MNKIKCKCKVYEDAEGLGALSLRAISIEVMRNYFVCIKFPGGLQERMH